MEATKGVVFLVLLILVGEAFGEKKKGRTLRPWEKACKGDKPKARGSCGISCASTTGEWLTLECSSALATADIPDCTGCNETMHCDSVVIGADADMGDADCLHPITSSLGIVNGEEMGIPPIYDPYLKQCVPENWSCPNRVRKSIQTQF